MYKFAIFKIFKPPVLYSIRFLYALAVRERITLRIGFRCAKLQLSFIAELAARDQEDREATEFDLIKREYN